MTLKDDFKTASLLAGIYGLLAAATTYVLVPLLPLDQGGALPLPLPMFAAILAIQLWLVYGLLAWVGLRLARARNQNPAPLVATLWQKRGGPRPERAGQVQPAAGPPAPYRWSTLDAALAIGAACGLFLIIAVNLIQRFAPHTLPATLHPPSVFGALLASTAAAFGEEILCRLLFLSLFLRLLPRSRFSPAIAIGLSALLFGAFHTPGFIFLYGSYQNVPLATWVWIIGLNGLLGIVYGLLFLKSGIESAIAAHFGTDLVWHVLSVAIALLTSG